MELQETRQWARRRALDFLERHAGATLSDEREIELALEAQRWARAEARKPGLDGWQSGRGT